MKVVNTYKFLLTERELKDCCCISIYIYVYSEKNREKYTKSGAKLFVKQCKE